MKIKTVTVSAAIFGLIFIVLALVIFFYVNINRGEHLLRGEDSKKLASNVVIFNSLTSEYLLFQEKRTELQWQKKYQNLGEILKSISIYSIKIKDIISDYDEIGKLFNLLTKSTNNENLEQLLIFTLFMKKVEFHEKVTLLTSEVETALKKNNKLLSLTIFIFLILFICFSTFITFFMFTRVLYPLFRFEKTVAKGIPSVEKVKDISIGNNDEFSRLSTAFNELIKNRISIENRYKELAEEFRATFEQVAVGVAHVGLNGNWLRVNQKLCEILGYPHDELLKMTFQEITHPDDLKTDLQYVKELIDGKSNSYSMEKRYLRKDSSILWVNLTVSLVHNSNKKAIYFISVIEDISERKNYEASLYQLTKKLTRSNEELENFAYVASHDLKAPLRAIENLANWLFEDLSDSIDEQSQRYLNLMKNRVERMEALLDGLLQYSRVGRIESDIVKIDTNEMIRNILTMLAPPDGFTFNIPENMPVFETEKIPLEMIFRNLIGNAIKHHDKNKGEITLICEDLGNFWKFLVKDDGPGIDEKYHQKIFNIFQTLKPRDELEGSGMGLSLVKKAVQYKSGSISIISNPKKERGTTFSFTWPK